MIVLGIETAGPHGSVALLLPGGPREVEFEASVRLGAELAPAIRTILADGGLGPERPPDLVAVDTGPGSYTGLRIGLAAAKGLAFAWSRPLVGVPTVVALTTQAAESHRSSRVLCALNASRGEVYAALYERRGGEMHQEGDSALHDPQELGQRLPGHTVVVGDAAEWLVDAERGITVAQPRLEWPTALRIAEIGQQRFIAGCQTNPLDLCPIYYRPNEAEEQRRKRSMRSV